MRAGRKLRPGQSNLVVPQPPQGQVAFFRCLQVRSASAVGRPDLRGCLQFVRVPLPWRETALTSRAGCVWARSARVGSVFLQAMRRSYFPVRETVLRLLPDKAQWSLLLG